MTNSTQDTALAERCEQAAGPDRELDALVYAETLGGGEWRDNVLHVPDLKLRLGSIDPGQRSRNFVLWWTETPAYTASLDAAMTLVPEGWQTYAVENDKSWRVILGIETPNLTTVSGKALTFALSLCAAALKAKAQQ